ncbi:hypothetical protein CW299_32380, partial [Pseudomonas aeruginosa]
MQGYQLTFITQQGRRHQGQPICDWLLEEARRLGVRGATALAASEGFGQSGRLHSMHFFELADQPQEILMAVDPEQSERLFESIRQAGVR